MKVKYNNELKDHKLTCGWCNKNVVLDEVIIAHKFNKKDRFTYACDHCNMSSEIKKSAFGFYSLYSYNKNRYYRQDKDYARIRNTTNMLLIGSDNRHENP